MSWGEFVQISAHRFTTGSYPWTASDFYAHSQRQHEAAPTVDPIVLILWEHDGPRVAESNNWWQHLGVWYGGASDFRLADTGLPLNDDFRLTVNVWRFTFIPLSLGTSDDGERENMLAYEIGLNGAEWTFENHLDDVARLCEHYADGKPHVEVLTLWQCDSGWSYVPGEPSEYESDWQLMGTVLPKSNTVTFEALSDGTTT